MKGDQLFAICLLAPAAVAVTILFLFPIFYTIWLSFCKVDILAGYGTSFVGFQNYAYIASPDLLWSIVNDLVFSLGSLLLQLAIGLSASLVLNERFRGNTVARSLILFPYLISVVSAVFVWKWMLNPVYGLIDYLIGTNTEWLGPKLAVFTTIVVNSYKYFPFMVLVILARLRTIPKEFYEAAEVDGSNALQRFRYITMPQLRNVAVVIILLRFIWTFNSFEIIWLLTAGGPAGRTATPPILTYMLGFPEMKMGPAAAIGVLVFVLLAIVYFTYTRIYKM